MTPSVIRSWFSTEEGSAVGAILHWARSLCSQFNIALIKKAVLSVLYCFDQEGAAVSAILLWSWRFCCQYNTALIKKALPSVQYYFDQEGSAVRAILLWSRRQCVSAILLWSRKLCCQCNTALICRLCYTALIKKILLSEQHCFNYEGSAVRAILLWEGSSAFQMNWNWCC